MSLLWRGRSTARVWILCIICAVFAGICFDNAQTDSCLAYQNTGNAVLASGVSDGSCDETTVSPVLRGARRGVSAGQAYVQRVSMQEGYAFIPRKTAQRTASRSLFWGVLFCCPAKFFCLHLSSGRGGLFPAGCARWSAIPLSYATSMDRMEKKHNF